MCSFIFTRSPTNLIQRVISCLGLSLKCWVYLQPAPDPYRASLQLEISLSMSTNSPWTIMLPCSLKWSVNVAEDWPWWAWPGTDKGQSLDKLVLTLQLSLLYTVQCQNDKSQLAGFPSGHCSSILHLTFIATFFPSISLSTAHSNQQKL